MASVHRAVVLMTGALTLTLLSHSVTAQAPGIDTFCRQPGASKFAVCNPATTCWVGYSHASTDMQIVDPDMKPALFVKTSIGVPIDCVVSAAWVAAMRVWVES